MSNQSNEARYVLVRSRVPRETRPGAKSGYTECPRCGEVTVSSDMREPEHCLDCKTEEL